MRNEIPCPASFITSLTLGTALLSLIGTASAQTHFRWNPSGTGTPAGGSGIWDATSARWSWDNGKTYEAWPATEPEGHHYGVALFGGTAGTVTTSGAIVTGGLYFETNGYTLNTGTGSTLTLVNNGWGQIPSITVAGATTGATINAPLRGSDGFILKGGGTLTLAGANQLTGQILIGEGTLRLLSATGTLPSSTSLRFGGNVFGESGGGSFILDNTGATAARTQNFDGLEVVHGDVSVISRRTAAQNLILRFNNYSAGAFGSRIAGATINFISEGGVNGSQNRIVLSGPDSGFLDAGTFFNSSDYAWKNIGSGNNGYLRAINYGVDSGTAIFNGGASIASTGHVRIGGAVTAQQDASFQSLKIDGAHDITIGSGNTLTTDGLLKTGGGSATINGGTILRNTGVELVVRTDKATDSLTINSVIGDTTETALVKTGDGTLFLNGVNTFAGVYNGWDDTIGVFLNAGVISVSSLPTGSEASSLGTGSLVFSGGTLRYTGSESVSTTRRVSFRGNGGTIDITDANAVVTLDSNITGTGGKLRENALIKTGAGTLELSGTTGNGPLTVEVDAGTLVLSKTASNNATTVGTLTIHNGATARLGGEGNQIDDYAVLTVKTGGTFDLNGRSEWIGDLSGGGSVTNHSTTDDSTLSMGYGEGGMEFSGVISNGSHGRTIALEKLGSMTQILTGNNTYTGGTNIRNGVLQIGNGGTTGSLMGDVLVEYTWGPYEIYDGVLAFNRSDSLTYGGTISGAGRIIQMGTGTLTLTGTNSYTGSTIIRGGTLSVSRLANGDSDSGIGASSADAYNLILDGGTLRYTGAARSTNRLFTVTPLGGTIDASGTGTLSFSSGGYIDMTGTGNRSLTLTGTGNGSLASIIENPTGGTTTLVKEGSGTWTLSGNNTFTGGLIIRGGTVSVSSASHLGASSSTINLAGGTLNLANNSDTSFNRSVTVSANSTVSSNRASSGTGRNHTLGALSIGSSTLSITRGSLATGTGSITFGATTLTGDATFSTETGSALTLGAINDGGIARTIAKSGSGTLNLGTAASGLTNGTSFTFQAGTTNLSHSSALGTLARVNVSSGATLAFGSSVSPTFGALDGAGSITLGSNTLTVGNSNNQDSSFSGSLAGTNGRLVKNGTGTLTLTGSSSYTGGTTINNGRVKANNTTGSAFGNGAVTVQLNSTLAGIGSFTGAATVHGTYAPGNSVGTLTSGSLTVASAGTYEWEINNATGTAGNAAGGWDLATVNGTLTFQTGSTLMIKSLGLDNLGGLAVNFDENTNYSWRIATATGTVSGLSGVVIDDSGFLNQHGGAFSLSLTGNNVFLNYTAVPEPHAILLASLGLSGAVFARRRQPSMRRESSL